MLGVFVLIWHSRWMYLVFSIYLQLHLGCPSGGYHNSWTTPPTPPFQLFNTLLLLLLLIVTTIVIPLSHSLLVKDPNSTSSSPQNRHKVALVSECQTCVLADASRWPLLSHMRSRAPQSYLSPTPLLPATGALTCYLLYFCISVFVLRYLYFFRYFVISVFHFHVLYCIFSSSFLVLPGAGSSQRAGARPNPTCHRRDLLNYTKHASGKEN